ncbi:MULTISPECIES: hypothetical protein [Yersinia pseudotuberculosis complex]|nr:MULTISPECIES: hypothetical protein [Yersinia pseudotuberculosis complex]
MSKPSEPGYDSGEQRGVTGTYTMTLSIMAMRGSPILLNTGTT